MVLGHNCISKYCYLIILLSRIQQQCLHVKSILANQHKFIFKLSCSTSPSLTLGTFALELCFSFYSNWTGDKCLCKGIMLLTSDSLLMHIHHLYQKKATVTLGMKDMYSGTTNLLSLCVSFGSRYWQLNPTKVTARQTWSPQNILQQLSFISQILS